MTEPVPQFWRWFCVGYGAQAGWRRIADRWLVIHALMAGLLFIVVPQTTKQASAVVMIPLASVFVGLTFAWIANVQTILMSAEIEELADFRLGGYVEYVFPFQLGVLIVLLCLTLWGLAGLGVIDAVSPECARSLKASAETDGIGWLRWEALQTCQAFAFTEVSLFFFASFAIRECWRLISGTMLLMISRQVIRKAKS